MQLIQKYASQKKVMEHLDHMMNHENMGQGKRLEKFMKEKIMMLMIMKTLEKLFMFYLQMKAIKSLKPKMEKKR